MMFSLILFGLFLFVAVSGSLILTGITKKKWGYTEKREQDLEKEAEKNWSAFQKGKGGTKKGGNV